MMLSNSPGWKQVSPLEHLIARACDVTLPEPNYAVNLEVADYINQKKANTPREAAMLIAHLANNRNPHIAMLALTLLDTLVQSCGYPFHLQMSTKEFLNELVRRFPERPPPFPNPVMTRILELIHGWKEGICTQSRWKDDLGNIRDMHRLLTFKGYRFRDLSRQHQDTLASASNIKTAEELENEDREAQSAKLQELIRRGTPRDLAAAQELMKSLAGANPDAKPDYRAQALTDLNKLESKVILLNEMLDNVDTEREEKFVPGDAYDQVATILGAARPKLQKWISDAESYDSESLDTFLQINDQINNVLNRYEAFKKGDYETARNPVPAELSNQSTSGQSLIDFDDDTGMQSQAGNGAGQDDLAGLFGPPTQTSQAVMSPSQNTNTLIGGMGMGGMNMAFSNQGVPTTHSPSPVMGGMGGMNNPMFRNTSMSPPAIMLPSTPANGSPARNGTPGTPGMAPQGGMAMNMGMNSPAMGAGMGMGFGGMGAGMVSGMGMGMGMSGPSQPQQQSFFPTQQPTQLHQQQQQNSPSNSSTAPSQASGKDPFADLAGLF